MEIDYTAIGKRVKKFRKSRRLSQEQLAELLDISVPHMSNIENGKTKFSFQLFVDLADKLEISSDILLYGGITPNEAVRRTILQEINEQLMECTDIQMQMIGVSVYNTKQLLQRYDEKMDKKK